MVLLSVAVYNKGSFATYGGLLKRERGVKKWKNGRGISKVGNLKILFQWGNLSFVWQNGGYTIFVR